MNFHWQKVKSPVGTLYLVAAGGVLHGVVFQKKWSTFKKRFPGLTKRASPVLREAKRQLAEYFKGRKRSFNLPLKVNGTAFQNRVWASLAAIPFGLTKTYKQQAIAIRAPMAVRAIGRADGLNPLCIVLPCHRVIGSSGALTGYAGGIKAKKFLLALEGVGS